MLAQQLRRLRRCRAADEIVVATTVNGTDDPVVAIAKDEGVRWFRGDEHDVLGRYAAAAAECGADLIARITADCPLIEPSIVDAIIARAAGSPACDYASNVIRRTYPKGLDAEALHADVLARTARLAASQPSREHVTLFIYGERPDLFVLASVEDVASNADLRWTVDTPDDLAYVRRMYRDLGLADRDVPYAGMLNYARAAARAPGEHA